MRHINYYFLFLVIFLVVFGALFLSTLSSIASLNLFGTTNYYLYRQLMRIAIGIVLGLVVFKLPLDFLKKIATPLLIINLVLLVIVFLPIFGENFLGASRWISLGKITFQPSEFLKITSILYLSALLSARFSEHRKKGWSFSLQKGYDNVRKIFVPFLLLFAAIIVILYFQKDLGTLGIVLGSLLAVYFASGTPLWHLALAWLAAIASALFFVFTEPYRIERLRVFLHLAPDPLGSALHINQNLIAMGSGGFFGKGLGMSIQKFGFLPQAMADSVFAIVGEELGIIGCVALVTAFLLFCWFGLKIARKATDTFSKLTATGITVWITLQAFMVFSATIGLIPLTGIPLPFFSYGGSHIITELIGIGILLNISKNG